MSKDTLWSNPDGKAGKRANPGRKRKLPVRQKKLAVRPVPTEPKERKRPRRDRPRANRRQPSRPTRTPYDPLQPLTGKDFNREINAALKMEFRPERNEIVKQQGVDAQQQANVSGWYDDYIKLLSGAQSQTAAAGAQVQQQAYALGAAQAGQDQAAQAPVTQAATESAALRGTTPAPDAAYQQAVAGRQGQSDNWASMLAAQGQAQTALAGAHVAAGGAARLQAQKQAQSQSGETSKAMKDLRQRRGATKVKLRGEMREGERKYALERQAFGLDVAEQAAAVRKAERDRRQREKASKRTSKTTRRGQNVTRRGQDVTARGQNLTRLTAQERLDFDQAKEAYDQAHPGQGKGKEGKYTQSQKNSAQAAFRRARSFGIKGIPRADVVPYLLDKLTISDPLIIKAAKWPKSLSAGEQRELRKMGIRVAGPKRSKRISQLPGPF